MLKLKLIVTLCISFASTEENFFSFVATDINGYRVDLNIYEGKVLLVVNVASECGFTDNHYKGLVKLQKLYEPTGKFTVLGFPCNQFGGQEPGSEAEILKFAEDRYDVNFPLFSKINVLEHGVPDYWKFLIEKSGNAPTWNFWKYLVSGNGQVLASWGPWTDVEAITKDVRTAVMTEVKKDSRQNQIRRGDQGDHVEYGEDNIEDIEVQKRHDEM